MSTALAARLSSPQTRVQLELDEKRIEEFEALMKKTSIATKKDLINQALTLFEWAVREKRAGRIIASVDEVSQRYKELLMPALEHVERTHVVATAGN
jgi:hypothetical protein